MKRQTDIARYPLDAALTLIVMSRCPSLFAVLASLLLFAIPAHLKAQQRTELRHSALSSPELRSSPSGTDARNDHIYSSQPKPGIEEIIPEQYKRRYQEWKSEFLACETGRRQWETYAHHPGLLLTITVSGEKRNGAITGKFKWGDSGNLIAATITLGYRIDEGSPDPIYYPVLSSLGPLVDSGAISGRILAAAKIAHEFGHVNQTALTPGALYQLQDRLIRVHEEILLRNGHNTLDPRLMELAQEMGATPEQIWEDREYWAERNAMLYLDDRITEERLRRSLSANINRTVGLYAKGYDKRFIQVARSRHTAAEKFVSAK